MSAGTLCGLRVLVTRPVHQAAGLVMQLEDAGAVVSTLPLLRIVPPRDAQAATAALQANATADLWIFTSANAVDGAVALHSGEWPDALFALGQGTVRALARHGHRGVAPEGGSSEDLLLWPELAALQGRRVLIVTGEGGRSVLAETLAQRGATVIVVPCYRREVIAHDAAAVAAAVAAAQVVVLTSGEAMHALLAWLPPRQLNAALLLPSQRVAQAARAAGFAGAILLPAAVSDAAILSRLEQWQRQPHNDCT